MSSDVNRSIKEQLSAFIDGELPAEELELLLRRLERDKDHRATLARYAAISGVIRGEALVARSGEFRGRVMAAVSEQRATGEPETEPSHRSRTGFAVAGGLAVAVALVFVLGLDADFPESQPSVETVALDPMPVNPSQPQERDAGGFQALPAARQASLNPERMTSYLVAHGQYARAFQSTMMDSRIVAPRASFER